PAAVTSACINCGAAASPDPENPTMQRRTFLGSLATLAATPLFASTPQPDGSSAIEKLVRSEEEWKQLLTSEQFAVLRREATERPHTSPLNNEKRKGTYECVGCRLALFT